MQFEKTRCDIVQLFQQGDYFQIYEQYAENTLKEESRQCVLWMKKDQVNGPDIAERLGYAGVNEYLNADSDDVIFHFFGTMRRPQTVPRPVLENVYYMQLALSLSLLIAPYAPDMSVVRTDVTDRRATVCCSGAGIVVQSHYRYHEGVWKISAAPELKKVGSDNR
jgi:hypothetical protein